MISDVAANLLVAVLVLQSSCCLAQPMQGVISAKFQEVDIWARSPTGSGAKVPVSAYRIVGSNIWQPPNSTNTTIACYSWLSYGYPSLVRRTIKEVKSSRQPTIFHFSETGFSMDVQLLNKKHRITLAKAAAQKYRFSFAEKQVGNLLPSRLNCSVELTDNETKVVFRGSALDLSEYPYSIYFELPNERERGVAIRKLRPFNNAEGPVDQLHNIYCDAEFHAAEVDGQYWQLTGRLQQRFKMSVRKADYLLYEDTDTAVADTDKQELESDCPAFRKEPWRTAISYATVPYAASIQDCTERGFSRIDGVTVTVYEIAYGIQWEEARLLCESVGWKLARLTTDNLWNAALQLTRNNFLIKGGYVWVGGRLESNWKWYDTNIEIRGNRWCGGNPISGHAAAAVYLNNVNQYYHENCIASTASGAVYSKFFMCSEA